MGIEYQPKPPVQFIMAARRPRITMSLYCPQCGRDTAHDFLWHEGRDEVYQCPTCKCTCFYRVG